MDTNITSLQMIAFLSQLDKSGVRPDQFEAALKKGLVGNLCKEIALLNPDLEQTRRESNFA